MTDIEVEEKINLKEIVDISEDEFKKQITAWIDERGISRKLQSKLRADLFEQFNRTKLGRQMSEQHQQAHRIVLSPLILVLNTLVAEFLYAEDCHFTLSVFANEVPYKNTLPNFEATPSRQLFRFSESELNDIFEAIGISMQNEQIVRDFYINLGSGGQGVLNKSLLFCIVKTLITQVNSGRVEKTGEKSEKHQHQHQKKRTAREKRTKTYENKSKTPSKLSAVTITSSSPQSLNTSAQTNTKNSSRKSYRPKYERFNSSRYFKYLNRYLKILSDRVNDMSRTLAEKHSGKKSHRSTVDSSSQEESIKKDLRQIVANINKLTKSQHKSRRFQDVLNSIERLSVNVEKCSGKLGDLLNVVDLKTKNELIEKRNEYEKKEEENEKRHEEMGRPNGTEWKANQTEGMTYQNQVDRFGNMDYCNWLRELKTSENGRKFIDRLEKSLQKTLEKERENLEKLYEEKTNNYRMLIRLHYKQKYFETETKVDGAGEKEDSSPIDRFTPDNTEKILAETLATRAIEKEQHVDHIVQTAKTRLQQLERESEELDQSFQAYLRRQQIMKQQTNDDASKIWENYSLSKAALSQFDDNEHKRTATLVYNAKLNDMLRSGPIFNSTFNDDVDIQEVLRDLNEIKRLKSPRFNKKEAFANETTKPPKPEGEKINFTIFESQLPEYKPLPSNVSVPLSEYKVSGDTLEMPKFQIETNHSKPQEIISLEVPNEQPKEEVSLEIRSPPGDTVHNPSVQIENPKMNTVPEITSFQQKVDIHPMPRLKNGKNSYFEEKNLKNLEDITNIETERNSLGNNNSEISKKLNGTGAGSGAGAAARATLQKNGSAEAIETFHDKIENKNPDSNHDKISKTPSIQNGFTKEVNFDSIEKLLRRNAEYDLKKPQTLITNGVSNKNKPIVSKISESDSNDLDSDQISIGPQRVKSPDDFWI